MLTILSTLFGGVRTYIEIGVVVALVGTAGFYKLTDDRLDGQLLKATKDVGVLSAAINEQNNALTALKDAQDKANAAAAAALQVAKKQAQTEYEKSKKILAQKGSTCDDAMSLLLESQE